MGAGLVPGARRRTPGGDGGHEHSVRGGGPDAGQLPPLPGGGVAAQCALPNSSPARRPVPEGNGVNAAEQIRPAPVAIIGIGCLFPRAADRAGYWANILNKVDAITEVPPSHWNPEDYFDPNAKSPDRTYARRGAFLSPVDFPPLDFGISPNTLEATDTTQLLGLV